MEQSGNKLFVPMSIIVAGVIIAGAIIYNPSAAPANDYEAPIVEEQPTGEAPTIDDDVVLGEANAPVTIIEFGDFECPFCGQLHENVGQQIRKEYIETGKVKMVYRDYPLSFHPNAVPAAEAAQCAADQGKYWAYHDELFARQANLAAVNYVSLAGELGMNTTDFKKCVDGRKYKAEVEKDYADGNAAGVEGTPATFINGRLISGAVPYSVFKSAIDAELAK